MKILAVEKEAEGVNWADESLTLEEEARYVYQLYLAGSLREIYFNEEHCAVLILECESKDKAVVLLQSLPLAKKGLIKFDVTILTPYTGYERIMRKGNQR